MEKRSEDDLEKAKDDCGDADLSVAISLGLLDVSALKEEIPDREILGNTTVESQDTKHMSENVSEIDKFLVCDKEISRSTLDKFEIENTDSFVQENEIDVGESLMEIMPTAESDSSSCQDEVRDFGHVAKEFMSGVCGVQSQDRENYPKNVDMDVEFSAKDTSVVCQDKENDSQNSTKENVAQCENGLGQEIDNASENTGMEKDNGLDQEEIYSEHSVHDVAIENYNIVYQDKEKYSESTVQEVVAQHDIALDEYRANEAENTRIEIERESDDGLNQDKENYSVHDVVIESDNIVYQDKGNDSEGKEKDSESTIQEAMTQSDIALDEDRDDEAENTRMEIEKESGNGLDQDKNNYSEHSVHDVAIESDNIVYQDKENDSEGKEKDSESTIQEAMTQSDIALDEDTRMEIEKESGNGLDQDKNNYSEHSVHDVAIESDNIVYQDKGNDSEGKEKDSESTIQEAVTQSDSALDEDRDDEAENTRMEIEKESGNGLDQDQNNYSEHSVHDVAIKSDNTIQEHREKDSEIIMKEFAREGDDASDPNEEGGNTISELSDCLIPDEEGTSGWEKEEEESITDRSQSEGSIFSCSADVKCNSHCQGKASGVTRDQKPGVKGQSVPAINQGASTSTRKSQSLSSDQAPVKKIKLNRNQEGLIALTKIYQSPSSDQTTVKKGELNRSGNGEEATVSSNGNFQKVVLVADTYYEPELRKLETEHVKLVLVKGLKPSTLSTCIKKRKKWFGKKVLWVYVSGILNVADLKQDCRCKKPLSEVTINTFFKRKYTVFCDMNCIVEAQKELGIDGVLAIIPPIPSAVIIRSLMRHEVVHKLSDSLHAPLVNKNVFDSLKMLYEDYCYSWSNMAHSKLLLFLTSPYLEFGEKTHWLNLIFGSSKKCSMHALKLWKILIRKLINVVFNTCFPEEKIMASLISSGKRYDQIVIIWEGKNLEMLQEATKDMPVAFSNEFLDLDLAGVTSIKSIGSKLPDKTLYLVITGFSEIASIDQSAIPNCREGICSDPLALFAPRQEMEGNTFDRMLRIVMKSTAEIVIIANKVLPKESELLLCPLLPLRGFHVSRRMCEYHDYLHEEYVNNPDVPMLIGDKDIWKTSADIFGMWWLSLLKGIHTAPEVMEKALKKYTKGIPQFDFAASKEESHSSPVFKNWTDMMVELLKYYLSLTENDPILFNFDGAISFMKMILDEGKVAGDPNEEVHPTVLSLMNKACSCCGDIKCILHQEEENTINKSVLAPDVGASQMQSINEGGPSVSTKKSQSPSRDQTSVEEEELNRHDETTLQTMTGPISMDQILIESLVDSFNPVSQTQRSARLEALKTAKDGFEKIVFLGSNLYKDILKDLKKLDENVILMLANSMKFDDLRSLVLSHKRNVGKKTLWILVSGIWSVAIDEKEPSCDKCPNPLLRATNSYKECQEPVGDVMRQSVTKVNSYVQELQRELGNNGIIILAPPIPTYAIKSSSCHHKTLHEIVDMDPIPLIRREEVEMLKNVYDTFCAFWTKLACLIAQDMIPLLFKFDQFGKINSGHNFKLISSKPEIKAHDRWKECMKTIILKNFGKCSTKIESASGKCSTKLETASGEFSTKLETAGGKCSTKLETAGGKCSTKLETASGKYSSKLETASGNCSSKLETSSGNCSSKLETASAKYSTKLETANGKCSTKLETASDKCFTKLETATGECSTKLETASDKCFTKLETASGECSTKLESASDKCFTKLETASGECSTKLETASGKCSTKLETASDKCFTKLETASGECSTKLETASGKCSTKLETASGKCSTKLETATGKCSTKLETASSVSTRMFERIVIVGYTEHLGKLQEETKDMPVSFVNENVDLDDSLVAAIQRIKDKWPGTHNILFLIMTSISKLCYILSDGNPKCAASNCKFRLPSYVMKNKPQGDPFYKTWFGAKVVEHIVKLSVCSIAKADKSMPKGSRVLLAPLVPVQGLVMETPYLVTHEEIHKTYEKNPKLLLLIGQYQAWSSCSQNFNNRWIDELIRNHTHHNYVNMFNDGELRRIMVDSLARISTYLKPVDERWTKYMIRLLRLYSSLKESDPVPFKPFKDTDKRKATGDPKEEVDPAVLRLKNNACSCSGDIKCSLHQGDEKTINKSASAPDVGTSQMHSINQGGLGVATKKSQSHSKDQTSVEKEELIRHDETTLQTMTGTISVDQILIESLVDSFNPVSKNQRLAKLEALKNFQGGFKKIVFLGDNLYQGILKDLEKLDKNVILMLANNMKFDDIRSIVSSQKRKVGKKALWILVSGIWDVAINEKEPSCDKCSILKATNSFKECQKPVGDMMRLCLTEVNSYIQELQRELGNNGIIILAPPIPTYAIKSSFCHHKTLHEIVDMDPIPLIQREEVEMLKNVYDTFCAFWTKLACLIAQDVIPLVFKFDQFGKINSGHNFKLISNKPEIKAHNKWKEFMETIILGLCPTKLEAASGKLSTKLETANSTTLKTASSTKLETASSTKLKTASSTKLETASSVSTLMFERIVIVGYTEHLGKLQEETKDMPVSFVNENVDLDDSLIPAIQRIKNKWPGTHNILFLIMTSISELGYFLSDGNPKCAASNCKFRLPSYVMKNQPQGDPFYKTWIGAKMVEDIINLSVCSIARADKSMPKGSRVLLAPLVPVQAFVMDTAYLGAHEEIHKIYEKNPKFPLLMGQYQAWSSCSQNFNNKWLDVIKCIHTHYNFANIFTYYNSEFRKFMVDCVAPISTPHQKPVDERWIKIMIRLLRLYTSLKESDPVPFKPFVDAGRRAMESKKQGNVTRVIEPSHPSGESVAKPSEPVTPSQSFGESVAKPSEPVTPSQSSGESVAKPPELVIPSQPYGESVAKPPELVTPSQPSGESAANPQELITPSKPSGKSVAKLPELVTPSQSPGESVAKPPEIVTPSLNPSSAPSLVSNIPQTVHNPSSVTDLALHPSSGIPPLMFPSNNTPPNGAHQSRPPFFSNVPPPSLPPISNVLSCTPGVSQAPLHNIPPCGLNAFQPPISNVPPHAPSVSQFPNCNGPHLRPVAAQPPSSNVPPHAPVVYQYSNVSHLGSDASQPPFSNVPSHLSGVSHPPFSNVPPYIPSMHAPPRDPHTNPNNTITPSGLPMLQVSAFSQSVVTTPSPLSNSPIPQQSISIPPASGHPIGINSSPVSLQTTASTTYSLEVSPSPVLTESTSSSQVTPKQASVNGRIIIQNVQTELNLCQVKEVLKIFGNLESFNWPGGGERKTGGFIMASYADEVLARRASRILSSLQIFGVTSTIKIFGVDHNGVLPELEDEDMEHLLKVHETLADFKKGEKMTKTVNKTTNVETSSHVQETTKASSLVDLHKILPPKKKCKTTSPGISAPSGLGIPLSKQETNSPSVLGATLPKQETSSPSIKGIPLPEQETNSPSVLGATLPKQETSSPSIKGIPLPEQETNSPSVLGATLPKQETSSPSVLGTTLPKQETSSPSIKWKPIPRQETSSPSATVIVNNSEYVSYLALDTMFSEIGAQGKGVVKGNCLHYEFSEYNAVVKVLDGLRILDLKMEVQLHSGDKDKFVVHSEAKLGADILKHPLNKLKDQVVQTVKDKLMKELNVYTFKTEACSFGMQCENKDNCAKYHAKADRRRNPMSYNYCLTRCNEMEVTGACHLEDNCKHLHNILEKMLHFCCYKKEICTLGLKKCQEIKRICFDAHSGEPDSFYHSTWKTPLYVKGLDRTLDYLAGAVRNLFKYPNLPSSRVLLITSTLEMAEFYARCIKDLAVSCHQTIAVYDKKKNSCDASIIIAPEIPPPLDYKRKCVVFCKNIDLHKLKALIIDDGPTVFRYVSRKKKSTLKMFNGIRGLNIVVTAEEIINTERCHVSQMLGLRKNFKTIHFQGSMSDDSAKQNKSSSLSNLSTMSNSENDKFSLSSSSRTQGDHSSQSPRLSLKDRMRMSSLYSMDSRSKDSPVMLGASSMKDSDDKSRFRTDGRKERYVDEKSSFRSHSRSPSFRSHSRSPPSRSRSPPSRSRSPPSRSRSISTASRSRSPLSRSRSRSTASRSRSPPSRSRSTASRSRSPLSRLRSPSETQSKRRLPGRSKSPLTYRSKERTSPRPGSSMSLESRGSPPRSRLPLRTRSRRTKKQKSPLRTRSRRTKKRKLPSKQKVRSRSPPRQGVSPRSPLRQRSPPISEIQERLLLKSDIAKRLTEIQRDVYINSREDDNCKPRSRSTSPSETQSKRRLPVRSRSPSTCTSKEKSPPRQGSSMFLDSRGSPPSQEDDNRKRKILDEESRLECRKSARIDDDVEQSKAGSWKDVSDIEERLLKGGKSLQRCLEMFRAAFEELKVEYDRELELYIETPEVHPYYEERYSSFIEYYNKEFTEKHDMTYCESLWEMYWKELVSDMLEEEYRIKVEDLKREIVTPALNEAKENRKLISKEESEFHKSRYTDHYGKIVTGETTGGSDVKEDSFIRNTFGLLQDACPFLGELSQDLMPLIYDIQMCIGDRTRFCELLQRSENIRLLKIVNNKCLEVSGRELSSELELKLQLTTVQIQRLLDFVELINTKEERNTKSEASERSAQKCHRNQSPPLKSEPVTRSTKIQLRNPSPPYKVELSGGLAEAQHRNQGPKNVVNAPQVSKVEFQHLSYDPKEFSVKETVNVLSELCPYVGVLAPVLQILIGKLKNCILDDSLMSTILSDEDNKMILEMISEMFQKQSKRASSAIKAQKLELARSQVLRLLDYTNPVATKVIEVKPTDQIDTRIDNVQGSNTTQKHSTYSDSTIYFARSSATGSTLSQENCSTAESVFAKQYADKGASSNKDKIDNPIASTSAPSKEQKSGDSSTEDFLVKSLILLEEVSSSFGLMGRVAQSLFQKIQLLWSDNRKVCEVITDQSNIKLLKQVSERCKMQSENTKNPVQAKKYQCASILALELLSYPDYVAKRKMC